MSASRAGEPSLEKFIGRERFAALKASYGNKWGVELVLLNERGEPVRGRLAPHYDTAETRRIISLHIGEAVRWGDAPFVLLDEGVMLWLAPVMINLRVLGCVAAFMDVARFDNDGRDVFVAVRDAACELLDLLGRENLTNPAILELHRFRNLAERRRAEAIHETKMDIPDFRMLYIREEPNLMSSIRQGDREKARGILNQILVVLFHQSGEDLNLVKSFTLEIITMMCRAAVEAGCDARYVFGDKYQDFANLSAIRHDYEFSPWLHDIMERLIDAIHRNRNRSTMPQMQLALNFMRAHLAEDITRDQVAGAAHMSASHFSRLFKKCFRENFTDTLNRLRIERAAELLASTPMPLSGIAFSCGFKDQSYFTKVFTKFHHKTPGEYRKKLPAGRRGDAF